MRLEILLTRQRGRVFRRESPSGCAKGNEKPPRTRVIPSTFVMSPGFFAWASFA